MEAKTLLASVMVVSFIITEWHLLRLSGQSRNPSLKRVHVNVKVWRKTPKADLHPQPDHGEHDVLNAAINNLMKNYNLEDLGQKLELLAQTIPKKTDIIDESNPTVLLQNILNEQRNRQNLARLQVLIGEARKRQKLSHFLKIFAQQLPGLNSSAKSGEKYEMRKQMPKFKFSSIRKSPMKK